MSYRWVTRRRTYIGMGLGFLAGLGFGVALWASFGGRLAVQAVVGAGFVGFWIGAIFGRILDAMEEADHPPIEEDQLD